VNSREHRKMLAEFAGEDVLEDAIDEDFENAQQEISSLRTQLAAEKDGRARAVAKLGAELIKARAQLQTTRRDALEEVTSILFLECQPNNGGLFSRMDDEIRALIEAPKTEGDGK
jgi:hypothetical protein